MLMGGGIDGGDPRPCHPPNDNVDDGEEVDESVGNGGGEEDIREDVDKEAGDEVLPRAAMDGGSGGVGGDGGRGGDDVP
jgi:hypothetical protein